MDGYSACFRQWRATHSHCSKLHGYALKFKIVFNCETLDDKNWCFDFGGMKEFKEWFNYMFDHTTIIAADDPCFHEFSILEKTGIIDLREMENVGCEKFAELVYNYLRPKVQQGSNKRVDVLYVECIENDKNSASYYG